MVCTVYGVCTVCGGGLWQGVWVQYRGYVRVLLWYDVYSIGAWCVLLDVCVCGVVWCEMCVD